MTVAKLIRRRLLLLPISLFVLVTLSFGLVEIMPGDPAVTVLGAFASPDEVARIHAQLGLDRPLHERYVTYIGDAVQGDLGRSFVTGQPVLDELGRRLPATIQLVALAVLVSWCIGLVLGTAGAYLRGSRYDRVSSGAITVFQSTPDFLLALLLIFVLFFHLGIAPAPLGQLGVGTGLPRVTGFTLIDAVIAGRPGALLEALHHLMLPVLALGLVYSAFLGRISRSTMGWALASRQVEFARACGLPEWRVIHYAFLQARTPILTYGVILFGALVGGAALVETVFSWQGAGQWALESILRLDIPVIQGFILAAGVITILVYLLLDVLVMLLDPRVRYG
jgi:ABC-type dipeptide/oligopeptide/nickel transport system permease component